MSLYLQIVNWSAATMSGADATLEKQLGGLSRSGKVPKQAKVKNKSAAELQITAEQLLREAKERELEIVPAPPKQKVGFIFHKM